MSGGKDSAQVVKFMTLFAKLKEWSDDAPEQLEASSAADASIKDLCNEVSGTAFFLKMNERRHRSLFAAPVDPGFLAAWRDYEERYETVVSGIGLADLWPEISNMTPSRAPKADLEWECADDEAGAQAGAIAEAIEYARFNADQNDRWDESQDDFIQQIEDGVAAWDRLRQDTGFDLQGVFRRRALIPFVLVPRQVAAKLGSVERHSMLKNLQQAHEAFVFGATYAALALMRSILEAVLRDNYGAKGKDLSDRIRHTRGRLPRGASEAALHRLRKLANAVLHLDPEKDEGLPTMDEVKLEKEVVSLLFVLRALIEGGK